LFAERKTSETHKRKNIRPKRGFLNVEKMHFPSKIKCLKRWKQLETGFFFTLTGLGLSAVNDRCNVVRVMESACVCVSVRRNKMTANEYLTQLMTKQQKVPIHKRP